MRAIAWFVLALLASCSGPIGNSYPDVDALVMAPEWQDWVVVGAFGPKGPFTLVETQLCEANAPCNFSHIGQGHVYQGFDDFELMVLRLESADGDVSHIVLRGKEKCC